MKVMSQDTGPLIMQHQQAHRAALLRNSPAAPSTSSALYNIVRSNSPKGSSTPSSNSSSHHSRTQPHASSTGRASTAPTQGLGPLSAAKLANAAACVTGPSVTGPGGLMDRTSGTCSSTHHSRQLTGSSTSSVTDVRMGGFGPASSSSPSSRSSSWAGVPPAAGAGLTGSLPYPARRPVATGGCVEELQETIFLRVLCHRYVPTNGELAYQRFTSLVTCLLPK